MLVQIVARRLHHAPANLDQPHIVSVVLGEHCAKVFLVPEMEKAVFGRMEFILELHFFFGAGEEDFCLVMMPCTEHMLTSPLQTPVQRAGFKNPQY